MALEKEALSDLTKKDHNSNTLYKELIDEKNNESVFKQDLATANKALHENGFPDLQIIDVKDGKFVTNKGTVDGEDLNKRLNSAEINSSKVQVEKEADGETVKDVVLSKDSRIHFDYKDKKLTGYTDENGDHFERDDQEPPTWTHKSGPDGKSVETDKSFKGTVSVDENGVVTKTTATDSKVVYPNGRVETIDKENSTVTENGTKITKSNDGLYEKIEYSKESGRGTIDMNIDKEGTIYRLQKNDAKGERFIVNLDTDGKTIVDCFGDKATVSVDSSGNLTIEHHGKDNKSQQKEVINTDGSGTYTDKNGKLLEVTKNGQKTVITRDETDGAVTKITRGETVVAASADDKKWTDAKGNQLIEAPTVDDNGKVTLKYKQGTADISPDGATTFDGRRRMSIDANSDGSNVLREVKHKDTLWAIAEDNLTRLKPDQDRPTPQQILAETRRIAAQSDGKIKSPNYVIHVGMKLNLSPAPESKKEDE